MTADHGPLCPNGVRCPDCGWPVPPEHDAAIAGRALRQAADAMLNEKGVTFADVWPAVQRLITKIVGLFNATGIFAKG